MTMNGTLVFQLLNFLVLILFLMLPLVLVIVLFKRSGDLTRRVERLEDLLIKKGFEKNDFDKSMRD